MLAQALAGIPEPIRLSQTFTAPAADLMVAFADWTAGNHLRHARFVGIRDDVDPREVVRERAA